MIKNKFTYDNEIDFNISSAYFAWSYHVSYKDKYKFENEVINDPTKPIYFWRNAFEDEDKTRDNIYDSIELENNMRFLPLPYLPRKTQEERSVFYICGAAGEGKSYLINKICESYNYFYPNNKIYFITSNNYKLDRSLNQSLYTFLNINSFIDLYSDPDMVMEFSKTTEFNNSFFVFDDIGVIEHDKKKSKVVWAIIDTILENKRKNKISIAVISHNGCNYKQTKIIINEIKNYIVYPATKQVMSDRILNDKLGLKKREIDYIVNKSHLTSQWCSIDSKRRILLTQRVIKYLDE